MKQQLICQFTKHLAWNLKEKKGQVMGQVLRNRWTEPGIPPPPHAPPNQARFFSEAAHITDNH